MVFLVNSGFFLASFWQLFAAIVVFWHHFGDVLGLFWPAFSAFPRFEPAGEPFQHHVDDLVLFSVPLLYIFKVTFAENAHDSWRSFGSFRDPFSFPSSPLERASAAKRSESVAWSRPCRRRGPKTTSEALSVPLLWLNITWDLPVLCNIASTFVLSVFWQLRFSHKKGLSFEVLFRGRSGL